MTIQCIEQLKAEGNTYFKQGNFAAASECYSSGLRLIDRPRRSDEELALASALYLNRAACHLKLKDFDHCVDDCNATLDLTPASVKAIYRRACAFESLKKFAESRRDALLILKLDPPNKDAIALMRRLNEISQNEPHQGLERFLTDLRTGSDAHALMNCVESIRAYCEDDLDKYMSFARARGLFAVEDILRKVQTGLYDSKLHTSVLRLLLSLLQFESIVKTYVEINARNSLCEESFLLTSSGKLSLCQLAEYGATLEDDELQSKVILLVMAILRFSKLYLKLFSFENLEVTKDQLEVDEKTGMSIARMFSVSLKTTRADLHQLCCDSIGAFVSDIPNYCAHETATDPRLDTLEQRKGRNMEVQAVQLRSKCHASFFLELNAIETLVQQLDSSTLLVRSNASTCLGKLLKSLDDETRVHDLLSPYLVENENMDIRLCRQRALVENCLLLTQPQLGGWALTQGNGALQLALLLSTNDVEHTQLASEVICLAAGNDKAAECLQPLVADGVLTTLLKNGNLRVQAAAASAMAKLAIKAKALSEDSDETAIILNSATHIIKKLKSTPACESSLERAIEIIAAMIGRTHVKQEIVFGSYRVVSIISELCALEIEDRSSVAFGVAFILSNLTVTNRELRALALADKDISVDQYEKMMELQRIKAKDENGDEIEEKKQDDFDGDDEIKCKSRIRQIVHHGGIRLLMKLANHHSDQTSLAALRALRQICVDESSRGIFIQQGGFKLCVETATKETNNKIKRLESAHALAKSLVTTNPFLLSDSLRLSAIRPLLFICKESDSNDLQKFEALLSLTNLLSCGQNEQDKFVHESGVQTVHYLVFSDNLMIRRASTEAFCNLSSHSAMIKLLRKRENIKLWLGLIEEWCLSANDLNALSTAKAAAGTLAMTCSDDDIASLLCSEDCLHTFLSVLENEDEDMTQRVLVAIHEIVSLRDNVKSSYFKTDKIFLMLNDLRDHEPHRDVVDEILKNLAE